MVEYALLVADDITFESAFDLAFKICYEYWWAVAIVILLLALIVVRRR